MWHIVFYNAMGMLDLFLIYVIFSAACETFSKKFVVTITFLFDKYFEMKKKFLLELAEMPEAVDIIVGKKAGKFN